MKEVKLFFAILFFISTILFVVESSSDAAFIKIGSYVGEDAKGRTYVKKYYLPRNYRTTHQFARSLCRAYDLEFAYIENLNEFTYLSKLVKENESKFVGSGYLSWVLIDGVTLTPKSPHDWHWTVNNEKISFELPFLQGQPDNAGDNEKCLSLGPSGESDVPYKFNDYPCRKLDTTFICQKMKIIDWDENLTCKIKEFS